MFVLGLTGSIGMGKSTAAALLRRLGVPVHDADRTVHRLLRPGGAGAAAVALAFPGALRDGALDREALAGLVFGDKAALRRLESIVHPLVRRAERRFLVRAAIGRRRVVVLDIPLLFETGGDNRCDATIVVTAPRSVQDARLRRRTDMTPARLAAIRARQMPDEEKRRRADFIVDTSRGRGCTLHDLARIVRSARRGRRARSRSGPFDAR
ncbi:MAG: dephospho-CoA kinase [Proteobacteria bacterium]|nr:dephospho-CoA kinase [Pseudomonadota bacterium]